MRNEIGKFLDDPLNESLSFELSMKDPFHAGSVTIAAVIILIMASISAPALLFTQTVIASTEGQDGTTTTTTTGTTIPTAPNNATQRVAVGGGNITLSINQFSPQTVEIQPGESVTFFAPQGSTEVHNVIFDLSNGTTISDVGVPFILPSVVLGGEVPTTVAEELLPAPPYNLGEPIIQNMTDGTQAIIGLNKVAFYPAVVDQYGNVAYLDEEELSNQMLQMEQAFEQGGTPMPSPLSTNYTMDGTESVVSSGIVLDVNGFAVLEGRQQQQPTSGEGEEFPPPQFPFLDSFTVTFSQPGTYDYFCAFHPGMFGQVVVGGSMEGQTSQTPTVTSPELPPSSTSMS
jgi:plastocyanin